jgi:hypothetical protein
MPRTYTEEEVQQLISQGNIAQGDLSSLQPAAIGGNIDFSSVAPQQNYSDLYTQQASDALPAGPGMLDNLNGASAGLGALGTQVSAQGQGDGGTADIAGGAMSGAASGAAIGTAIAPGIGTAIGAVGGAVVGGGLAALGGGEDEQTNSEKMDEIQKHFQTLQVAKDFSATQNKRAKPGIKGLARSIISPLVGIT